MKNKIMAADEAVAGIRDGATVMIGGFMGCGSPEILIDALVKKTNAVNLISAGLNYMNRSSSYILLIKEGVEKYCYLEK